MDTIQVPVLPHVLKYLHYRLGEHYFLSVGDMYGLVLFHQLRRPLFDARHDHKLRDYEARWHVHLGPYGRGRGFHPLSGKSVHEFNSLVHDKVYEDLHDQVEIAVDHGQQVKFAIEHFMLKHGFDESDIKFDTLLKSWQRYTKARRRTGRPVVSLTGRQQLRELQKGARRLPPATPKAA